MDTLTHDDIRTAVRARYGTIAETRGASAPPTDASGCGRPSPEAGSTSCGGGPATTTLDMKAQHDLALRAGCVAGASLLDDLEAMLIDAGFVDMRIQPKDDSKTFIREWGPGTNIADYLISATIEAVKP